MYASSPPHSTPPSYEHDLGEPFDDEEFESIELPVYSPPQRPRNARPRAPRREQSVEYKLELKKGRPYLALQLVADGACAKNIPMYIEGTPIKGEVRMDVEEPETVQDVVLNVHGRFITGLAPDEQVSFVNIWRTLWASEESEDSDSQSASCPTPLSLCGLGSRSPAPRSTGRLQGTFNWPFSIDLPRKVSLGNGQPTFHLPHSLDERGSHIAVCYEITVRVRRTKLKPDRSLSTVFRYITISKPPPFLPLKRLAYQERVSLMGPTIDMEGWHSVDPITIKGMLFRNRRVSLQCTLYLSKPLGYARGALIPLCMRLQSDDLQVLDLLSSPSSIKVVLRRSIKYKALRQGGWRKTIEPLEDCPSAVWWPSTEHDNVDAASNVRYVNGELHLRSSLKPSEKVPFFQTRYAVALLPFEAIGFVQDESGEDVVQEHPVDIATMSASGPPPIKFAPPGYERVAQAPEDALLAVILSESGLI